jgi:hypothetical protein
MHDRIIPIDDHQRQDQRQVLGEQDLTRCAAIDLESPLGTAYLLVLLSRRDDLSLTQVLAFSA